MSYEGLEQLHRFIFIMAVTHVTYSCLTMLLAIVKVSICGVRFLELNRVYLSREALDICLIHDQLLFIAFGGCWAAETCLIF